MSKITPQMANKPVVDFTLPATGGGTFRLSEALSGTKIKSLVLYFYPKDNTPGCTTEGQHFRDLHATLIHQMGLDPDRLSYLHQGRRERLTEVHGRVLKEVLA